MRAYEKVLVAVDGSAAAGKGLREVIRLAKAGDAQLVILHVVNEFLAAGARRRGMTRLVMGSDAEEVVRSSPIPVLLVRAGT